MDQDGQMGTEHHLEGDSGSQTNLSESGFHRSSLPQGAVDEGRLTLLAHLEHPGVVRLESIDVREHGTIVCSERIRGSTLAATARSHDGLDLAQATFVGFQLASALTALHSAGVVHGDVSPQNVLIYSGRSSPRRSRGQPVLIDLHAPPHTHRGTPGFRAPEMLDGQATTGSDIYSLAATMLWCTREGDRSAMRDLVSVALATNPQQRPGVHELGALLGNLRHSSIPLVGPGEAAVAQLRSDATLHPTTHAGESTEAKGVARSPTDSRSSSGSESMRGSGPEPLNSSTLPTRRAARTTTQSSSIQSRAARGRRRGIEPRNWYPWRAVAALAVVVVLTGGAWVSGLGELVSQASGTSHGRTRVVSEPDASLTDTDVESRVDSAVQAASPTPTAQASGDHSEMLVPQQGGTIKPDEASVLLGLIASRDAAINAGDTGLVAEYAVHNAPVAEADVALLGDLADDRQTVRGYQTRAVVVRISGSQAQREAIVWLEPSDYELVDANGQSRQIRSAGVRCVLITLQESADRWLIRESRSCE